jgi:hypothetical protein
MRLPTNATLFLAWPGDDQTTTGYPTWAVEVRVTPPTVMCSLLRFMWQMRLVVTLDTAHQRCHIKQFIPGQQRKEGESERPRRRLDVEVAAPAPGLRAKE